MVAMDQLHAFCQSLIRIPSLSGEEQEIATHIAIAMKQLGYDAVHIDAYGSVTGSLFGKEAGPSILLDGHIDTVGITNPELWTHDPYGAQIVEGKLYGRGSSDMKCALAAMILAASDYAKQTAKAFKGSIHVSATVCEECFEGVAARLVSERVKPDLVIIGEATNLALNHGQRGRAELVVEAEGVSCHSSNPEKGVNAIESMLKVLPPILNLPVGEHPILGKGILVLTDIISDPYPGRSVLPSRCRATFDRRLLPQETRESVLAPIQAILDQVKASVSISQGSIRCYTGATIDAKRFFPAWVLDEDDPVVVEAQRALKESGLKAPRSHYSFCTNASHFAAEANIPTLGFGPSLEEFAHTVDEYCLLEQLDQAYKGYSALLAHFTTSGAPCIQKPHKNKENS